MTAPTLIIVALLGYLLGSVPFGLVLTRMAGLGDIRSIGSGNFGATNVLRTGRKDLALLTTLLDMSKAAIAAGIAMLAVPEDGVLAGLIAGTAAVLGHNFPVWLKFRGGKGVAATIGMMLVMNFPSGACVGLTWLAVAFATRYSSLSALVAIGLSPLYAWLWTGDALYAYFYGFLAALCWVRHHANIIRLLTGQESRISLKKKA